MQLSKRSELACVQQLHQLQASAMLKPKVRTRLQCETEATTATIRRGLDLAAKIQALETKPADDSASQLQHSREAVTVTKDSARVVYTMQLSCTEQNEVFCARDTDDNRLVVFIDDGSEVTLIASSTISKEWDISQGERINLTGIGDKDKQ